MIEQLSGRIKKNFKLANNLATKERHILTPIHILFILIDNPEKYIDDILRNISTDLTFLKKK